MQFVSILKYVLIYLLVTISLFSNEDVIIRELYTHTHMYVCVCVYIHTHKYTHKYIHIYILKLGIH